MRDNVADCDDHDMLIGEVCRAKLWNMCEWGDRLLLLLLLYYRETSDQAPYTVLPCKRAEDQSSGEQCNRVRGSDGEQ